MKTLAKVLLLAALVLGLSSAATATELQDTQIVTISIEAGTILDVTRAPVRLTVGPPTAPGDEPVTTKDNLTKALYTLVVPEGEMRALTAQITASSVPAGLVLKLKAINIPEDCGTAASEVILNDHAVHNVITGIGSCTTGEAGAIFEYSLGITDVEKLEAYITSDIEVTITLANST